MTKGKNKCTVHYIQTYTKNNNTRALLQTTGGKDEPNIVLMRKSYLTRVNAFGIMVRWS